MVLGATRALRRKPSQPSLRGSGCGSVQELVLLGSVTELLLALSQRFIGSVTELFLALSQRSFLRCHSASVSQLYHRAPSCAVTALKSVREVAVAELACKSLTRRMGT